jgi:N-acetylmuramoyl-L-alanine amidase
VIGQGSSGTLRAPVRTYLALTSALLLALPAFGADEGALLMVVLDPGHGGKFPHDGAHGRGGLIEKNLSLAVAQKTKQMLEAAGATVVLTRETDEDISLTERARIANEAGADLFVSIHCNSMEKREDRKVTRGVETYFLSPDPTDAEARMLAQLENGGPEAVPMPKATDAVAGILNDLALGQARNDSAALAEIIHHHMIRNTSSPSRGVRQAPFLVLSGTKMPSALVEIGFISHPQEGRLLAKEKYQSKVAKALADGVRDFADRVLSRRLLAQVREPAEAQPAHAAAVPAAAVPAASPPAASAPAPGSAAAAATPPAAPTPAVDPPPSINAAGLAPSVASPGGTR